MKTNHVNEATQNVTRFLLCDGAVYKPTYERDGQTASSHTTRIDYTLILQYAMFQKWYMQYFFTKKYRIFRPVPSPFMFLYLI